MAWFGGKRKRADDLIANKQYAQAVELLLGQYQGGHREPRLRLQLADTLLQCGKGDEAVPILSGLADEFAREGFAAKAIAMLKKIERIEPGRADVEQRLATLIEKKQQATVSVLPPRAPDPPQPLPEIGMEEIGGPDLEIGQEVVDEIHAAFQVAESAPEPSTPIVASPLFSDFSQEELLAVIHGLELQTFEPGDIIITEGEPGDSLFVLATGTARAFVKDPQGRHVRVRDMSDGAFFGEISVLTRKPRTATVTAVTPCELLELHRPTLEKISASHPRVTELLEEFYRQRTGGS
jgi:cAMP-dependent protein kinase regulator